MSTLNGVDDPVVMDANWRFSSADRRVIDSQIITLQKRMLDRCGRLTLNTTSATPAPARRYAIADGYVVSMRAMITVRSTDNSGAVMGEWEVKVAYKRIAGTLASAYTPVITNLFKVGLPGDPTLVLNGNTDVDLYVTGIAATNLTWNVSDFVL